MSRLALFLLTLSALVSLVIVLLTYGLTATVATGVVLTLAGAATTVVLRLADTTQAAAGAGELTETPDADGAPPQLDVQAPATDQPAV